MGTGNESHWEAMVRDAEESEGGHVSHKKRKKAIARANRGQRNGEDELGKSRSTVFV